MGTEQWAQIETQEVLSEHQKTFFFFYYEGDQAMVQIGQRGGRSLSLEIFKSQLDSVLGNWL